MPLRHWIVHPAELRARCVDGRVLACSTAGSTGSPATLAATPHRLSSGNVGGPVEPKEQPEPRDA